MFFCFVNLDLEPDSDLEEDSEEPPSKKCKVSRSRSFDELQEQFTTMHDELKQLIPGPACQDQVGELVTRIEKLEQKVAAIALRIARIDA